MATRLILHGTGAGLNAVPKLIGVCVHDLRERDYPAGPSPASAIRGLLKSSFDAANTPGVVETGQIHGITATATKGLDYFQG